MIKLIKETPYPATPNYSRAVHYRPMGFTSIERKTGWFTHNLKNVSQSSRNRLHKLMQGKTGAYQVGKNYRIYYFV